MTAATCTIEPSGIHKHLWRRNSALMRDELWRRHGNPLGVEACTMIGWSSYVHSNDNRIHLLWKLGLVDL